MKRAFISFDYDHDEDLKHLLVGQSKHSDTDFEIADHSIKEHIQNNWKDAARRRIRGCEVVIIICGAHTHTAEGVAAELLIAQEEGIPYFLLWGRSTITCFAPTTAKSSDQIYRWTWDNLKRLVDGQR